MDSQRSSPLPPPAPLYPPPPAPHDPQTTPSTPSSSPGLFSPPMNLPVRQQTPTTASDGTPRTSPFLHPLQAHKVRETYKAQVEQDFITGRKCINQYEIIDEIGRGVHGKVKLARSFETGEYVAIKIIQRFSKRRRLGRVTVSPEDKTKREIAILKKVRHPNVVGLLEIIDDPELKKIYMVLEHVELGEIVWRKKGSQQICLYERRRIERGAKGEKDHLAEGEKYFKMTERRRQRKEAQRAKNSQQYSQGSMDYWSLEHGHDEDDADTASLSRQTTHNSSANLSRTNRSLRRSNYGSSGPSRATSRAHSRASSRAHTPLPTEFDIGPLDSDNEDDAAGPLPSIRSHHGSFTALEGSYYGSYPDEPPFRGRSPSMADSIISHMSSVDDIAHHDAFEDDFSYVPCFTLSQARVVFRDTVLGLEYLHYEGIVHRDIKPANLLWNRDHRVKISDFGVSYFGRPIRDGELEENIAEADAQDFDDDLELAKTVGTPAFFAPEICYTDLDVEQPKVNEQIDVWSLGITLYCLIFARIPFMAEDEYQLFRKIAKEDVYIPRRRLKPVDPSNSTSIASLTSRQGPSAGPYREESELVYEEIDSELYDLIRRMLLKDPAERIKLREVKRHPWVLKGIDNLIGWLDDTDPSRKAAGRRIQVDDRELERAVVSINLFERAQSVVKKTVRKILNVTRTEKSEGSRRRAISSATSSSGDHIFGSPGAMAREDRRGSLKGDEFRGISASEIPNGFQEHFDHPLAQSLVSSPDRTNDPSDPFSLPRDLHTYSVGATPKHVGSATALDFDTRPGPPDRTVSAAASIQTLKQQTYPQARTVMSPTASPSLQEEAPITPAPHREEDPFGGHLWQRRGRGPTTDTHDSYFRVRSADRGVFNSEDKHSLASVATSDAIAPGHVETPGVLKRRQSRSVEASPTASGWTRDSTPASFLAPYNIVAARMVQSVSTPNVGNMASSSLEDPESRIPAPAAHRPHTPESYQLAQAMIKRRAQLQFEAEQKRYDFIEEHAPGPRPDDGEIPAVDSQQTTSRAPSSSSIASAELYSHIASPADVTSPLSSVTLGSKETIFPSNPSLPALISGASSASGDPEGEFLQHPGIVQSLDVVLVPEGSDAENPPPHLLKTTSNEASPTDANHDALECIVANDDADEDSDSDDGLTMPGPKTSTAKVNASSKLARRGTNASVGSTETAKKVFLDS